MAVPIESSKKKFTSSITDRCQSNQAIQNSHLVPWFWLMPNRSYVHASWTSIGSLGWIALPPRSSLMKCKASYLRRGWVERNSFPSWPNSESFIWPTELHILFHYGAMNILEFLYLEIKPLTPWAWSFFTKPMLILDISEVFCAKLLRVLRSS